MVYDRIFVKVGLCLVWKGQCICGGRGGMTVKHILMLPQYLNNNHVTYYVITQVDIRLIVSMPNIST